jgi:hypothetical protein
MYVHILTYVLGSIYLMTGTTSRIDDHQASVIRQSVAPYLSGIEREGGTCH